MPWWSWILLWVALAALSALFVVALGIHLWRGFMATVREFETATDRLVLPEPVAADRLAQDPASSGKAILMAPRDARRMYHEGKTRRAEARRLRRVKRRAEAGRPQRLRDLPGF